MSMYVEICITYLMTLLFTFCITPSVLLSHWWHRMIFLLQHHRLSLKDFLVCGLLTKGTRNHMEKSLYMRVWLKVNFDELSDM